MSGGFVAHIDDFMLHGKVLGKRLAAIGRGSMCCAVRGEKCKKFSLETSKQNSCIYRACVIKALLFILGFFCTGDTEAHGKLKAHNLFTKKGGAMQKNNCQGDPARVSQRVAALL